MKKNDLDQACVVDQFVDEFDEMDLIETRVREARFMETDLAAHLRDLGVPDAKVVIESLDDDPCISVHGFLLPADEASELLRRLDPRWEGMSCERKWEGLLPEDETPDEKREREEREECEAIDRIRQKQARRERHAERKAEKAEKAERRAERKAEKAERKAEKAERKAGQSECETEQDASEFFAPSAPKPLNREERKELAACSLALAKSNGHDLNDPQTKRQIVANIIDELRKRKTPIAAR